jgi:methionyl-tRNA formyltransferase
LKIVFFGTPEFAVAALQKLVESGCRVAAVVTAPDKPGGRGLQLQPSPVKQYALSQGLPVLQPTNLKSPEFQEELRGYRADLQVIVAFRMLPEAVWDMPRLGTFNVHASLLPQYRGAAPINWAIINGETETGVTTFFLRHEIDTGDLILQDRVEILPEDNAGTLYGKLMQRGAELAVKTVRAIEAGTVQSRPQVASGPLKSAPKIFKETGRINWEQPSVQIHNFIRGLSPYPAAYTSLQGKQLKVFASEVAELGTETASLAPGNYVSDGKTFLAFRTADGLLRLTDLQLEGKKRMPVTEFLRGAKL